MKLIAVNIFIIKLIILKLTYIARKHRTTFLYIQREPVFFTKCKYSPHSHLCNTVYRKRDNYVISLPFDIVQIRASNTGLNFDK